MKKYVIFDTCLYNGIPDVALIVKEGLKTFTVTSPDIEGLIGFGTTSSRVDKDKVIAILTDEQAIVRAMFFLRMMKYQHREVVKASEKAWGDNLEKIRVMLKEHQKNETKET